MEGGRGWDGEREREGGREGKLRKENKRERKEGRLLSSQFVCSLSVLNRMLYASSQYFGHKSNILQMALLLDLAAY